MDETFVDLLRDRAVTLGSTLYAQCGYAFSGTNVCPPQATPKKTSSISWQLGSMVSQELVVPGDRILTANPLFHLGRAVPSSECGGRACIDHDRTPLLHNQDSDAMTCAHPTSRGITPDEPTGHH